MQETPLHQELHPSEPLHLLHPESRGCSGERRHPLQPKLAVLQPAFTGEVTILVLAPPEGRERGSRGQEATCPCVNSSAVTEGVGADAGIKNANELFLQIVQHDQI